MSFVNTLPSAETFNKQKAIKTLSKLLPASKTKKRRNKYDSKFNN